jgi:hypothetical protein
MAEQYKCAICGGVFDKADNASYEKAREEYQRLHPDLPDPTMPDSGAVQVCDPCYRFYLATGGRP